MHLRAAAECSVGIGAAQGGRSRNEDNYLVCRDGRVRWRYASKVAGDHPSIETVLSHLGV